MNTRKNFIGFLLSALLAFLVCSCASEEPIQSAQNARKDYQQMAQNEQIKQNAPVQLYETQKALEKMNEAIDKKEDKAEIDHLAYLVQQHLDITKAAAQQKIAANQIQGLNKEMAQIQSQQKVEQSAFEAKQAKEKASALEKELEQIKQASVHEEARGIVLTLGDVFFDTGKATLKSGAEQNLNALAQFLKENPQRNVVIEGYTDNVGSAAYNRQLSAERARAVVAYLTSQGINRDRLIAQGYGESFPVANNETAAGRQLNRRVEVVVLRDGQPMSTAIRQPTAGETESFAELDSNQDGYLSKSEAQPLEALSDNFEQYDSNHDDRLSRSEFSSFEEEEIQQQQQQQQQPQQ